MKLTVLGASGAEFPGHRPPAFLIDDSLLLDAGTIGAALGGAAQWKIRHILVTHCHLDHIKAIPFLADNIIMNNHRHTVNVMGLPKVLRDMRNSLFNDKVWPDFTIIPRPEKPIIRLIPIRAGRTVEVNGYKATAFSVTHSVAASGYLIEDRRGKRLLYTGDTGPTSAIWKATQSPIDCAIIEVSFPDSMKAMALKTGHLTPSLLAKEIKKMIHVPETLLVTHPKPLYLGRIERELKKAGLGGVRILRGGEVFRI